MKPAPFQYVAPRTIDEAIEELTGSNGEAKLLAGGQSLVPLLNFRLARPTRLVDLNRVASLAYIAERDGGLAIGAMTRDRAVERDTRIAARAPLLAEAIRCVGHPAIRSRGTLGGSIAHADPAAELPAVALCLEARIIVRGPRGERRLSPSELYLGYLSTSLDADEIITEVWFPAAEPHSGQCWLEFSRRHGDFAIVGVADSLTLEGEAIRTASIAFAGVGGAPLRVEAAEAVLLGGRPDPDRLSASAEAARAAIQPDGDMHASADYRRHLAGVLLERAVRTAYQRARSFSEEPHR